MSEIDALANRLSVEDRVGGFIPSFGETCFRSIDGSDVAIYLTRMGFVVTKNLDTGRCGLAYTACGLVVSTNGYVSRIETAR